MDGPLSKLMQGYGIETDNGMEYRRPIDSILEVAKRSGGMDCPVCGHNCTVFFGDPDGAHWCICCQTEKEYGLEPRREENLD